MERDAASCVFAHAELDGPAVELLFAAAKIHHDLVQRRQFVDKPEIGVESILPVLDLIDAKTKAFVIGVESAVTDCQRNILDTAVRIVDIGVVCRPCGVVGEELNLPGHIVFAVIIILRIIGDGIVAQIDLDGDVGLRDTPLVYLDMLAFDGPGEFRTRGGDEGTVDRGVVQFASVIDLDIALFDDQIVGDGDVVVGGVFLIPGADPRITGLNDDVVGDAPVKHVQ